jgi:2-polyprenyl-6-methoxyphenol hydroxylase-like FAD-dependent oxidoreductase
LRVGIIGCGVAGQAAAIALARDGHDVTVLERFAVARPVGAGLLLQPSGLAALARLGLREAAEHWGGRVERLDGRTARGRKVLQLAYANGDYGMGIHRAALFDILHGAMTALPVKLELNFEVTAIKDGRVISRDGRALGSFDLVLICSGAHDGLRNTLGARVHDPVYPWGAFWTTCADKTGAFGGALRQVYDGCAKMMGILPIGRVPGVDSDHVAFFWSLPVTEREAQTAAGLDVLKDKMLALWPAAETIVRAVSRFEDLSFASYRDVHVHPWRGGRVLVMGDGAHGTSPQLGQGGNLALIDAITLAHCLKKESDVERAMVLHEKMRRPHVRFYQLASRALTPVFQSNSRVIGWARDTFMAPMNMVPGANYAMRTTLSGVRKFPFGIWKPPE